MGHVLDRSLGKPDDVGKASGPHSWRSVSLLPCTMKTQVIPVARGTGLPGAVSRSSGTVEKSSKHSQDHCCPEAGVGSPKSLLPAFHTV